MPQHYEYAPKGWCSITKPLQNFIEKNGATVLQIKEKFGGLRVYVNYNGIEEKTQNIISGAIRFAEFATSTMCVMCGNEGKSMTKNGWMTVLCDVHDHETIEDED